MEYSMNEKAKQLISFQNQKLLTNLDETFGLPIYQDTVSQDERPETLNLFLLVFGDFTAGENPSTLNQEIYVTYLAEGSDTVETDSLDVISAVSKVKAIQFLRTEKDQVQKLDTDEYVDRVNFIFRRTVKYECPV
ncbi:hypothetical protein [Halobacillus salinus]|uniref:DUF3168 domain-containing protein n=1 Tax=Halobacillus salinus TaxID=192814 RepID=A0A4Z0H2U3_9BACI|nr:hypothetical protein [Halobacillus salinus]TGB04692.1 hypothetical protein E4663_06790 [Halobacillus salinus]